MLYEVITRVRPPRRCYAGHVGRYWLEQLARIPVDIDARDIVLVDDVLHTGRTIRAALNEIFDYGRPRSVVLAVLVERA